MTVEPSLRETQIVWINGAFGIGKSSAVESILSRATGVVVFDPELLGDLATTASSRRDVKDYQDIQLWRALSATALSTVSEHSQARTILVPMTITNGRYAEEIFRPLHERGAHVHVVTLVAEKEILLRRIEEHMLHPRDVVADADAKEWRNSHVDSFRPVSLVFAASSTLIDTTEISQNTVGELIMAQLVADSSVRGGFE